MYKDNKISLVIPCLNEEKGMAGILRNIPEEIDEVIVVDNDSTDNTAWVAKNSGAAVILEREKGYGIAYLAGAAKAEGDVLITLDGDGTYGVHDALKAAEMLIDNKYDLVFGNRLNSAGLKKIKFFNKIGNVLLTLFFNLLTLKIIRDSQSGLWAVRKEILDKMSLKSRGFSLPQEIKMEAVMNRKIKYAEIDINYFNRIGESKLHIWKDGFINFIYLFKKRLELKNDKFF